MEAIASYTFCGSSSNELSFSEGETVKILNDKDPEWYLIEQDGQQGYAPLTYIQFNKPLWYRDVTKAEAIRLLSQKSGKAFRHTRGAFLVRPSESGEGHLSISVRMKDVEHFKIVRENGEYFVWRVDPHFFSVNQLVDHYRRKSICQSEKVTLHDMNMATVKVRYDYKAQTPEEIDIHVGEKVTLLEDGDQDWWKGQIERDGVVCRGLFPATYVKK